MQRFALLPVLFASACLGTITGGEDPEPNPPPPSEPAPVTLTVRDGQTPLQGVKVIFQASDESVIADATTDASGVATTKMPDGGTVTVIRSYPQPIGDPTAPPDRVWTYTGVKPGDSIELVGTVQGGTPITASVNVGLTNGELVYIQAPCGSGYGHAPAITMALKGCDAETDFYLVNLSGETDPNDGTNSGPLFAVTRAQVAPTIDLSGSDFRGTLSTQYSASNMIDMEQVYLQKRLVTASAFTVFDTGPIPTTTQTADIPELPSTEAITTAHVNGQIISTREPFSSAPVTIDVAANLIPTSSAPQLAGSALAWTQDGTGTPDLSVATITVGAVDRYFVRTIAVAYTGAQLTVPALPAPHDKYNVKATDTPRVDHFFLRVTGGYDGVRARIFNGLFADLVPMGGTATVTHAASTLPPDQTL